MDTLKENTNLDNFRVRIGKLQHTFDKYQESRLPEFYFYPNFFTPEWMYESKSGYVKVILSELAPKSYRKISGDEPIEIYQNLIDFVSCKYGNYTFAKTINNLPREDYYSYSKCYYNNSNSDSKYHTYKLIYWWLVVLAIDNDLYNKYLDYVVDAADIFGFTEDMIADWCEAVIYWLNGNDINKNCDLQLKTAEGNRFFINKTDIDDINAKAADAVGRLFAR